MKVLVVLSLGKLSWGNSPRGTYSEANTPEQKSGGSYSSAVSKILNSSCNYISIKKLVAKEVLPQRGPYR